MSPASGRRRSRGTSSSVELAPAPPGPLRLRGRELRRRRGVGERRRLARRCWRGRSGGSGGRSGSGGGGRRGFGRRVGRLGRRDQLAGKLCLGQHLGQRLALRNLDHQSLDLAAGQTHPDLLRDRRGGCGERGQARDAEEARDEQKGEKPPLHPGPIRFSLKTLDSRARESAPGQAAAACQEGTLLAPCGPCNGNTWIGASPLKRMPRDAVLCEAGAGRWSAYPLVAIAHRNRLT